MTLEVETLETSPFREVIALELPASAIVFAPNADVIVLE